MQDDAVSENTSLQKMDRANHKTSVFAAMTQLTIYLPNPNNTVYWDQAFSLFMSVDSRNAMLPRFHAAFFTASKIQYQTQD